jgi:hypothetical protein
MDERLLAGIECDARRIARSVPGGKGGRMKDEGGILVIRVVLAVL